MKTTLEKHELAAEAVRNMVGKYAASVAYTGFARYGTHKDEHVFKVYNGQFEELNPRLDVVNHSPDGLSWGYSGSGPAQLSFALLFDLLMGDRKRVQRIYQYFKDRVIAKFTQNQNFMLTGTEALKIVYEIEAEQREMENGTDAQDTDE